VTSLSAGKIDYLVKSTLKKDILTLMNYCPKLLNSKFKRYPGLQKERKYYEEILEEMMNGNEHAEGKQLEDRPVDDTAADESEKNF
jgi:RNA recognition motif-containing protein